MRHFFTYFIVIMSVPMMLPALVPKVFAQSFTFTAAGDHANGSNFRATLDQVRATGARFHIALGDNSYSAGSETTWCNEFFTRGIRAVLISGNHDTGNVSAGGNIDVYKTKPGCTFGLGTLTGNYGHQYYFDYPQTGTPLARFILIKPDIGGSVTYGYSANQPGYTFTRDAIDSARSAGIKWIIVSMHKNCITTGQKSCEIGTDIVNLLINKKVDLVLQGHDHNYQRSHALSCMTTGSVNPGCIADSGTDGAYTKGAGTVFIIIGTGGQGLYTVHGSDSEAGYFAKTNSNTFGATSFTIDAGQISVSSQFLRSAGGSFSDSFTISDCAGCPTPTIPAARTQTPRPPSPTATRPPAQPTATNPPAGGPTATPFPTNRPFASPTNLPAGSVLPGDINQNGQVEALDYSILFQDFQKAPPANTRSDINADGLVNALDYVILFEHWGQRVTGAATIAPTRALTPSPPHPTPPPTASGCALNGLTKVDCGGFDPDTDSDNYVNGFILDQVRQGQKNIAAGGVWWGPVDKFYENQVWIVNKSIFPTRKRFNSGETITQALTCLKPGKYPPKGTAKNTIADSHNLVIQRSGGGYATKKLSEVEQFTTMTLKAEGSSDSYELRTRCLAKEGATNTFGDGSPLVGDGVQVNVNQVVWFNKEPGTGGTGAAHHPVLPATHYDILDAHAWYEKLGYAYATIDGARDESNGDMSSIQLVGATVRGSLIVYGFGSRGTSTSADSKSPVHHIELRIDQNGDDYTAQRLLAPPSVSAGLGSSVFKNKQTMTLDTTKIADGWHILSWHTHIIDHQNPAPRAGKQLASELKLPICVANTNASACP